MPLKSTNHRLTIFTAVFLASAAMLSGRVHAQQFEWQSFTSMTSVRAIAVDTAGGVWGATAGGAFRLQPGTDEYRVYRNVNALSTTALTSVAADRRTGVVAVGGISGELDFLTPAGTWRHTLDIKTNEQRRSVNALMFNDSLLYIAADYGVSTYDVERFAFISTGRHLGTIAAESRALSLATWRGKLYVGTEAGLAFTPLATPNIADAAFWNVVPAAQLPTATVRALAGTASYLYVGTSGGLRAWDGANALTISGPIGEGSPNILAMTIAGDTVFAATATAVYQIIGLASNWAPVSPSTNMAALAYDAPSRTLFVGDAFAGLVSVQGTTVQPRAPNSPGGNIFSSVTFDQQGAMWAASTISNGSGSGVYRYDGTTWQSFSTRSTPPIFSNDVHTVTADSLGNIWAGTYGQGLLRLRYANNAVSQDHFDRTNSPFSGISSAPTFALVNGSVTGANDVQWFVPFDNTTDPARPHIVAYDPHANGGNGQFYPFASPATDYRLYFDVVIDGAGTKWLAPVPSNRIGHVAAPGLLYFNERGTLDVPGDDISGLVSTTSGGANGSLRTNEASAVSIDNDGELWVGTAEGINIISNPEAVLSGPSNLRIRKPFLSALNGENANITCLTTDPLNNKWIGTYAAGLFVVSPDGSQQLAHFDRTNSPILDDKIFTVVANKSTGLMYIGTANGLSVVRASGLIQAVGSELRVGPQPYIIPSETPLYFFGVPQDAELKIYTVSGALVRDYAPGALAELGTLAGWDGKDMHGELAASGVYLVAIARADGTSQVKKFAVVRH